MNEEDEKRFLVTVIKVRSLCILLPLWMAWLVCDVCWVSW